MSEGLLALPLACALSVTAAGEVAGQALPEVPDVPPIELPSLPETPPLEPPSQLEVPSVPEAPAVPQAPAGSVPRTSVPTPSVSDAPASSSDTPVAPSTASTSSLRTAGAQRTAGPSPAARASSRSGPARADRRQSAARRRAADSPRERRFRRSVKDLWACSYAVGGFERDVLVRRAGLEGFSAASAAAVAGRLGVSVRRVRTAQTSGLRRLRGANRTDGCAMSSPTGGVGSSAETLLAVATAPPLATDAGDAVANAPDSSPTNDRIEVLGEQRASTGVKAATAPRATVTLAAAGDGGPLPWPLILILALLAIAAATPLLMRRRQEGVSEAQVLEGFGPPEPTPPPAVRDPGAPPAAPTPEPLNEPAPSATKARGAVRPGWQLTGIASLAVTLLMRASTQALGRQRARSPSSRISRCRRQSRGMSSGPCAAIVEHTPHITVGMSDTTRSSRTTPAA